MQPSTTAALADGVTAENASELGGRRPGAAVAPAPITFTLPPHLPAEGTAERDDRRPRLVHLLCVLPNCERATGTGLRDVPLIIAVLDDRARGLLHVSVESGSL